MTALRFNVYAKDGTLIDTFTEDELMCVKAGMPEKSWHEAALWAYLAAKRHQEAVDAASTLHPVA